MSRFMMTTGLAASICCAIAFAGETTITDIKKVPVDGGKAIEIQVEGTNKLDAGETFVGWTPTLLNPKGQPVTVAIVQFAPPPPGGNATKFKYRYVVTDLQADKGDWFARSSLEWKTAEGGGSHITEPKKITIP